MFSSKNKIAFLSCVIFITIFSTSCTTAYSSDSENNDIAVVGTTATEKIDFKYGKYYSNIPDINCYLEIDETSISLHGSYDDMYAFWTHKQSSDMVIDEELIQELLVEWDTPKEYLTIFSPTGTDIAWGWTELNGQLFMTEGCHLEDEETIIFYGNTMCYSGK